MVESLCVCVCACVSVCVCVCVADKKYQAAEQYTRKRAEIIKRGAD